MNATTGYQLAVAMLDGLNNSTEYQTNVTSSSLPVANDIDDLSPVGQPTNVVSKFDGSGSRRIGHLVPASISGNSPTMTFSYDVTSAGTDVEISSGDGVPLWLPYVIITIVMLLLIAVSFARFHIVRGYQYRKRHQGSGDSDSRKDSIGMASLPIAGLPNGSAATVACRSGVASTTPEYLTMFLEFSRDEEDERRNGRRGPQPRRTGSRLHSVDLTTGNGRIGGTGSARRPKRTQSAELQQTTTSLMMVSSASASSKRTGNRKATGNTSRRPLAYTFNANGSMVDVRCSDDERTKTFRLSDSAVVAQTGSGNENGIVVSPGGAVVSGLPGTVDDDESVVIVVAADDYTDEYYDQAGNCNNIPLSVATTSRGIDRYYSDSNCRYVSPPSRRQPEMVMTSSAAGSSNAVVAMRYAPAAAARSTPSDDFRSASDFRPKRM